MRKLSFDETEAIVGTDIYLYEDVNTHLDAYKVDERVLEILKLEDYKLSRRFWKDGKDYILVSTREKLKDTDMHFDTRTHFKEIEMESMLVNRVRLAAPQKRYHCSVSIYELDEIDVLNLYLRIPEWVMCNESIIRRSNYEMSK